MATATLPAKPKTEVVKASPTMESAKALEEIAKKYALTNLKDQGQFERAIALSQGIRALSAAITPEMMQLVMELKDTSLGFITDRPPGSKELESKGPYTEPVVRNCFIEATLRGAYPVNNEWNIIAGRPYLAKNFYLRAVSEYPGIANLKLRPGVPSAKAEGCLVPFSATWDRDGKPESIQCVLRKLPDGTEVDERIAVRVNAGMGVDAIIGKATRKILARIYSDLTGSIREDSETEAEVIDTTATVTANGQATPAPMPVSEPPAGATASATVPGGFTFIERDGLEKKVRVKIFSLGYDSDTVYDLCQDYGAQRIEDLSPESLEVLDVRLARALAKRGKGTREPGQEG